MITEEKYKSWEKTCSTVESYMGGTQSTEAWRILKNLRKNKNGGQCFNPIPSGKWERTSNIKQGTLLGRARN